MKLEVLATIAVIVAVGFNRTVVSAGHEAGNDDSPSTESSLIFQDGFEAGLAAWTISAASSNQAAPYSFMVEEGFESGLEAWTLTGQTVVTSPHAYVGETALLLDYQSGVDYVEAARTLTQTSVLHASVYFYDNGDSTLGTLFQIEGVGNAINCGSASSPYWVQPNSALGIKTDVSSTAYVMRVNCPNVVESNGTFATDVPRRTGWHLFELFVTPTGTYARIDDREISLTNPAQSNATIVALISTWGLTGQAIYDELSLQAGYQSSTSLLLDYNTSTESALSVSRGFAPAQNILARTFFYDTLDPSLETLFAVSSPSDAQGTGVGVATRTSSTNYVIQIDSESGQYDAGIRRCAGWHLFEVIVTDHGSYVKIDNHLISRANPNHTVAAGVSYLSGGGVNRSLLGQGIYDQILVVQADDANWQDQIYAPLKTLYEKYSTLVPPGDAFVFAGLYPQLGYCAPDADLSTCGVHSNDFRSVMDTAIAWALYGKKTEDPTARALARRVFLEGWSNAPWKRPGQDVNAWARGLCLRSFAHAAYILWDELDPAVQEQIIQDLYAQAQSYADQMPESGYIYDTKAEENAWHASFLAAVVNLFPNAEGFDKEWIESKARCFAYHAITRAADGPYCGIDTQTVWDDWRLENHGKENPTYSASTLQMLGEAAFTYRLAGRPVPWEFTHNARPLFERYMTYVNPYTYHYNNATSDWQGAHDTAFLAPTVFRYMEISGIPTGISWQDYLSKRSIFYYGMSNSWLKKSPAHIRMETWNQLLTSEDSYKFLLDATHAGEFYGLATYSFGLPLSCEEDLYKEKIREGMLHWACDRSMLIDGYTSIRLSAITSTTAEAYSPLSPVVPDCIYKVSYDVRTSDLLTTAQVLARLVPAQYTSAAQESDSVDASNRIDAGIQYSVNQSGTTGWVNQTYDFATADNAAFVRLRGILAEGGESKGTAWFDDIEMIRLYKQTISPAAVDASSTTDDTSPTNVVDGELTTRWTGFGDGQWIRLDLGKSRAIAAVRIAFYRGDERATDFDIQTSPDAVSWTTVFSGSSSGTTSQLETFDVSDTLGRYVRVVGHGNVQDEENSFAEIEVWKRLDTLQKNLLPLIIAQ